MVVYIEDIQKFNEFLEKENKYSRKEGFLNQFLYPILLFGSMGAITWAMRGSSGFGGFDGTLLPGLFWAILFYYVCNSRGIDVRSTIFWLGIGISIGGMLGYGIYASWIHGDYFIWKTSEYYPINPIWGWIWALICGFSWGGTGGAFLGWAVSKKKMNLKKWIIRIFLPLGFALLGLFFLIIFPNAFFPYYNSTDYPLSVILEHTNTNNFLFLMWWIGTLFVTGVIEKEKTALKCNLILSLFIGIGFTIGISWNLLYDTSAITMDYWKLWEITTGFFGGVGYVFVINIIQNDLEKQIPDNQKISQAKEALLNKNEIYENQMIKIMEIENKESLYRFSLLFSILFLILWGSYGTSYSIGYYFEFYEYSNDQYEFPTSRLIILILIWSIVIFFFTFYLIKLKKSGFFQKNKKFNLPNMNAWIRNLMIYFTIFASLAILNPNVTPLKIVYIYLILYWIGNVGKNKMNIDGKYRS